MHEAGLNVTEYSANYGNSTTPEAVQNVVEGYIDWMQNLPLFNQAIELGWVEQSQLEAIVADMSEWSKHPDAFLATGRCQAIGQKG